MRIKFLAKKSQIIMTNWKGYEMSIPDYYEIAMKWQRIAEQGCKPIYHNGKKQSQKLNAKEISEARKNAKHYFEVAKEFGQYK